MISGFSNVDQTGDGERYAAKLEGYYLQPFWVSLKARVVELLEITPESRVLDLGCGLGRDIAQLSKITTQGSACGLDLSLDLLQRARANHSSPGLHYVQGAGDAMPFRSNTFDAVRFERVLMHVPHAERCLGELARV